MNISEIPNEIAKVFSCQSESALQLELEKKNNRTVKYQEKYQQQLKEAQRIGERMEQQMQMSVRWGPITLKLYENALKCLSGTHTHTHSTGRLTHARSHMHTDTHTGRQNTVTQTHTYRAWIKTSIGSNHVSMWLLLSTCLLLLCVCVCVCSGCLCVCVACSCGACCGVRRFMAMKLLSGSTTLMRANTKRTQKIQREGGRQKHTHTHALTDRLTPHTYTHTHTYYIQRG